MKQLGAGELGWQAFQFQGNVSYNPGGTFEVPVSGPAPSQGSVSFVRASTASSKTVWSFQKLPHAGFTQAPPTCTITNASGPTSSTVTIPAPPSGSTPVNPNDAAVSLGAGDVVKCAFMDNRIVNTDVTVFKQTTGGFGGPFAVTVTPPDGSGIQPGGGTVTTTAADSPVQAATVADTSPGATGDWTLTEDLSTANSAANVAADAGSWSVSGFDCNGTTQNPSVSETVSVTAGESLECTFTNNFVPNGSLTITKTTIGGVGTNDLVVTPLAEPTNTTVPVTSPTRCSVPPPPNRGSP